ncbi:MAG: hypothetical protein OEM41_03275 [Ignavibacteria bacterium]|nr:hypothetical protein [Ignavibacteria bacterium]
MKLDFRFPGQVLATLVIVGALAAYPLWKNGSPEVLKAVLVGAGLSTLNVLAGYFAIAYAFERSHTAFLTAILGGMGIRMAIVLGALVVLIKVAGLHAVALTVSLLVFYVLYLVLEILYIQKRFGLTKQD